MKNKQETFSYVPLVICSVIFAIGGSILIFGSTYFADYLQKHFEVKIILIVFGASLMLIGGIGAGLYMKRVDDYNKTHGIYRNPLHFWRK